MDDPHQNIKSGISQQPLLGFSSNFKLELRGQKQYNMWLDMKTTCNGRLPLMEDNLKLLKVRYLSNH